jgi:acyl carrier protein
MIPTRDEAAAFIAGLAARELDRDTSEIDEDMRLDELDSLGLIEALLDVEDQFRIEISDEEAARCATLRDAIDLVMRKAGAA